MSVQLQSVACLISKLSLKGSVGFHMHNTEEHPLPVLNDSELEIKNKVIILHMENTVDMRTKFSRKKTRTSGLV